MWIYYAIIFALFFLSWQVRRDHLASRQVFVICAIAVSLFVGFRYAVGCDFFGYMLHFDLQNSAYLFENIPTIDPLYWALMDLINFLRMPYVTVNVVTAVVFFLGMAVYSRRFENPMAILAFSFPLMIFALPMSATRQALAAGFVMIAFSFGYKRRYVAFAIFVVLAAQFHSSAVLFLAYVPLMYFGGGLKAWALSAPLLLSGAVVFQGSDSYATAVSRYVDGGNDAAGAVYRMLTLFIFGLIFQLYLRKAWMMKYPESGPIISVSSYIMLALLPGTLLSPTIADRFGQYLVIFAATIAAMTPRLAVGNRDQIYLAYMMGWILFFVGWSFLSWQVQLCYNPYYTWLFGIPEAVRFGR